MILIDGKKIATELREELKKEVLELKTKHNTVPGLAVILVGEDSASKIYVKNKEKFAKEVGMNSEALRYPADLEEKELLKAIQKTKEEQNFITFCAKLPFLLKTPLLSITWKAGGTQGLSSKIYIYQIFKSKRDNFYWQGEARNCISNCPTFIDPSFRAIP